METNITVTPEEVAGICYVVFGLMAVVGTVLDADGVMAAIRRLPKRAMDGICAKIYKFIMEHRPGLLMKFDLPHVDTIPKDRLYQINFRIDEADGKTWLMDLFVMPEVRGQGMATRIIETAKEYCLRRHIAALYLFCDKKMIPFYEKRGFEHVQTKFDSKGNSTYIMVCPVKDK